MAFSLKSLVLTVSLLIALPVVVSAGLYWLGGYERDWRQADRSSAGLLPPAEAHPDALVRIYAARTVRWRGIFAVHSWVVVKEAGEDAPYVRYDYTAWGEPVRVNGFAPDGRWFGREPELVFAADGERAARLISGIVGAVESYPFQRRGEYRAWPGPNSNTFVAYIIDAVPGLDAVLPPTAIGKDYPYDRRVLSRTPTGPGLRLRLGGYFGVTAGVMEGLEVNLLGAVLGIDLRRPALKLPGLGRLGMAPHPKA